MKKKPQKAYTIQSCHRKRSNEKNMSSENIPNTLVRNHHATAYYDYNTFKDERDNYSKKV
jgi:hypothetical protein